MVWGKGHTKEAPPITHVNVLKVKGEMGRSHTFLVCFNASLGSVVIILVHHRMSGIGPKYQVQEVGFIHKLMG